MKSVLLLSALAAVPARALPSAIDLDRISAAAGAEGFAIPEDYRPPAPPPPAAVSVVSTPPDDARVSLEGLLDRHWTATDWFDDGAGRTFVAGTLDLAGNGWLVVTPPGRGPLLIKIARGMSGSWTAGGRRYSADLNVSIFRARLSNILEIRSEDSGATLWRRRIIDLFQKTYEAGLPVVVAGRPYRLFLSHMPDASGGVAAPSAQIGLCLIYDELDGSGRSVQYGFYRFSLESMQGAILSVRLYGGDQARLQVSSDGKTLFISR